jgi:hypothetical protein
MAAINAGKVVAGGLLAGLVFNVLDFVANGLILAGDFTANTARLGLDAAAAESGAAMATWVTIDFLMGILVVWTYAAMRPRFGPGPRTAILAGLVPYLSVTLIMFGLTQAGLFTAGLFWKATLLQIVVLGAGALAGCSIYKEEAGSSSPA